MNYKKEALRIQRKSNQKSFEIYIYKTKIRNALKIIEMYQNKDFEALREFTGVEHGTVLEVLKAELQD